MISVLPEEDSLPGDLLLIDIGFPMQYDTFPPIEQDPQDFVREVEATGSEGEVPVLEADEPFDLDEALYYLYIGEGAVIVSEFN